MLCPLRMLHGLADSKPVICTVVLLLRRQRSLSVMLIMIKVVSFSKSSLWRCLCRCAVLIASHTLNPCTVTLITLKDKNSYPHFTLEQLRNLSRGAWSVSGLQGLEPRPFDSSDGTAVQTLFRLRSEPKDFSAFIPNVNYSDFSKYLFLNQHMDSLK